MNGLALTLAAVAAVIVGGAVWWVRRNLWLSALSALALIGLVAAALPWNVESPSTPSAAAPPVVRPPARVAPPSLVSLQASRPIEVAADGFVGSDRCRDCHPGNHATWHASYHRSMTQEASPDVVLGNFDDVKVSFHGRDYHLRRHGEVCWSQMHDPALPVTGNSQVNVPIVMTTGSHHMQVYWYATGVGRVIGLLPIVHWNETNEWIPRSAAFLQPEENNVPGDVGKWNMMCSACHSTHQRERPRPGSSVVWDTQVGEFGISCEACHGPGEQHIRLRRELETAPESNALATRPDPIINPADLSHVRSSQVCGQCHSVRSPTEDERQYREHGHGFRPGADLQDTHLIWERNSEEMREFLDRGTLGMDPEFALSQVYYDDGVVRVSGREYNGLKNSACHIEGELSCLSCHQMHKSESDSRSLSQWADDQLSPDALDDAACLQCHQQQDYSTSHTHHQAGSSGAKCYNCHMPHTTYGLLKAIRSHRIGSPDLKKDLPASRPNACNLCHLDKTLEWTATHLKSWYGIESPPLDEDQRQVAASLLWILKGNAAERALVSWSMGWSEAQSTSGTDWQAPFLSQLLNDPYAAVRLIARRSMQSLPGFDDLQYDPLATPRDRTLVIEGLQRQWLRRFGGKLPERPELLIEPDGVRIDIATRLLQQRDNRRIELAE